MHPLALVLAAVSAACAQAPRTLVFQAVDAKTGAVARGLEPEDLEAAEGGRAYPLLSLRFGASPMDLVLVLDTGPQTIEIARAVAQGARLACMEFDPGDRLAFVTFASSVKVRFPFTATDGELGRRVERPVDAASWSRALKLYDAMQAAVDLFPTAPDPSRARAVLVVTNSFDNGSRSDLAAVERAAKEKNVAIFAVSAVVPWARVYQERRLGPSPELVAEHLRPAAEATGGEARVRELSGYILRESFERIRSRYVATYAPAPGSSGTPAIRLTARGAIAFSNLVLRGAW
jgi:hypothetical protein